MLTLDSEIASCGVSSIRGLCDDCKGGSSSGEKRETNVTLNQ
jgi:hypothetical protein